MTKLSSSWFLREARYVITDTIFVHFLLPYSNHTCFFYIIMHLSFLVFIYRCMHFVMLTFLDSDIICLFCLCSFILLNFCALELLFFPYYIFTEHKLVFDDYKPTPKPIFYLTRYLCCISVFFKLCHQQYNSFRYIRCTCFSNCGQILFCILQTVKTINYG